MSSFLNPPRPRSVPSTESTTKQVKDEPLITAVSDGKSANVWQRNCRLEFTCRFRHTQCLMSSPSRMVAPTLGTVTTDAASTSIAVSSGTPFTVLSSERLTTHETVVRSGNTIGSPATALSAANPASSRVSAADGIPELEPLHPVTHRQVCHNAVMVQIGHT